MSEVTIKIAGMDCGGCVKNVTNVLTALGGVEEAQVSLEAAEARIRYDESRLDVNALRAAIEGAGFDTALE